MCKVVTELCIQLSWLGHALQANPPRVPFFSFFPVKGIFKPSLAGQHFGGENKNGYERHINANQTLNKIKSKV